MIDLHLHSHYSFDGSMSLSEIVQKSQELGLSVISLTDHDSILGVEEIIQMGRLHNITVIPGIELSTVLSANINNIPFYARLHILGYQFDYKNPKFQKKLNEIQDRNTNRFINISSYLANKCGVKDTGKDINTREKMLTKVIQLGLATDRNDAKKVINSNEINNLFPPSQMSTKEAIDFIKEMDGIPVLAHAYEGTYKSLYSDEEVSNLIDYLVTIGIEGIETHHYLHLEDNRINKLTKIAKKYNLTTTVGSDCHSHTKIHGNTTGYQSRFNVIKSSKNCDFNTILSRLNIK